MTEAADTGRSTPWHLWLVGVIAVLWNGFGGYDYYMSHTAGHTYYEQMGMTAPQIAYFDAMPTWMHAVWAVGVWGSVLGSVLLLLRSKWAFHAFALSFVGVLGNLLYTFLLSDGAEVMGGAATGMTLAITAACAFFVWYSWTMSKRGVLR